MKTIMSSAMAGSGARLLSRLFAYVIFVLGVAFAAAAHAQNYSDIWWNPSESGWGLTLVDHETQLAGVWYTYAPDGRPIWYVMPAVSFTQGKRFATLDIYQTTGPAYNVTFDPGQVVQTKVGVASFDFAPPGLAPGIALFSYTIGEVSQTKQVQRTPFGDAAPVWGTDYTDILWNANESGWGLALVQHGSSVGGVWYTYGADGQPLWVLLPAVSFTSPTSFSGPLYTATGPAFSSVPFDTSQVHLTLVGDASISFTKTGLKIFGDAKQQHLGGNFIPTLNNFTQFKAITFVPFATARANAPVPTSTCTGSYSATVDLSPFQCTNNWTFNGSFTVTGINFDRTGPLSGTATLSSITDEFQGAPGACSPVGLRTASGTFTGSMGLSRIGSGTLVILGESLAFQFSVGSLNSVLGTIAGGGIVGRFSCSY